MSSADFLARLRGAHEAEEPGARGIERVARNPDCLRLRALTIAGFTPASAAAILGVPPNEGQSPFALAMGQRFEKRMFENGAANLFALYREEGLLAVNEAKFIAIDDFAPGASPRALQKRAGETRRLLDAKRRADPNAPNIIVKPRLSVDLVGVPHAIEPDYLVAADADVFYRVGELKSYPDRGGKTDPADIRSACRQAAVGVVGLRQALSTLGVSNPSDLAAPGADLVLRVTGLFMPTLSRMAIEGEVASVARASVRPPLTCRSSKRYSRPVRRSRTQRRSRRCPIIIGPRAKSIARCGSTAARKRSTRIIPSCSEIRPRSCWRRRVRSAVAWN
jgi:hypothetical protein